MAKFFNEGAYNDKEQPKAPKIEKALPAFD